MTRNFVVCKAHEIIFRRSTEEEGNMQGMWHIWEKR
jgi:hypothetical protein